MKPSTFLYFSCFSHMEEKSFSRKQKKFSHNLTSCFFSPPASGLWTYYYSVQSSKLWHHDLFFNSFLLQDSSFKSLFQSSVWWFQWRQMKHLTCVKCWDRHLPEINLIYRNVINININQSRPAPGFTPFVVWLALFLSHRPSRPLLLQLFYDTQLQNQSDQPTLYQRAYLRTFAWQNWMETRRHLHFLLHVCWKFG